MKKMSFQKAGRKKANETEIIKVLQMIIWEVWFPVADCMLNLVFTSMLKNHASKKKNCFSVNEKPNVNV